MQFGIVTVGPPRPHANRGDDPTATSPYQDSAPALPARYAAA